MRRTMIDPHAKIIFPLLQLLAWSAPSSDQARSPRKILEDRSSECSRVQESDRHRQLEADQHRRNGKMHDLPAKM